MTKEPTILIVDDEEKNVRLLKAILKPENYDVFSSLNGEDALKFVKNRNVDLVLLDVIMLGMSGFKVCEIIKNNRRTRHIPILMLSVLTGTENHIKARKAGADFFLSRPVGKSELLTHVKTLLQSDHCGGQPGSDSLGG